MLLDERLDLEQLLHGDPTMLSFRDGDGRGAEGIIADERVPKAKFR